MLSVGSGAPVFIAEYEKSTAIDLASSEGMDGVKVDNDRLGQLRRLGRHESRQRLSPWSRCGRARTCLPLAATARRESGKIHLPALSTELSVLNREQTFVVVEAEGPFKDPH